jgi:hypothetical protein
MPSTTLRKQTAGRVGVAGYKNTVVEASTHTQQYVFPRLWVLLLAL